MANILGVGINVPIDIGNNGWFKQSKDSYEAIKTNIRCLLNTIPGERVMQPNLGLNLLPYIFEPVNDNTVNEIIKKIKDTIFYWLPYVIITDVNVNIEPTTKDENTIHISISFSIGSNSVIDTVTFKI